MTRCGCRHPPANRQPLLPPQNTGPACRLTPPATTAHSSTAHRPTGLITAGNRDPPRQHSTARLRPRASGDTEQRWVAVYRRTCADSGDIPRSSPLPGAPCTASTGCHRTVLYVTDVCSGVSLEPRSDEKVRKELPTPFKGWGLMIRRLTGYDFPSIGVY